MADDFATAAPQPLAERADFSLGRAHVSPSRRVVRGPGGETPAEPRVMQVLLVLHDAAGALVTRERLLAACWPGVTVGDDSLNRTIGEIRRIARSTDAGFEVETIRGAGYRLTAGEAEAVAPPVAEVGRRSWLTAAGAAAAVLGVTGGGAWLWSQRQADARTAAQIEAGRAVLRRASPARFAEAAGHFRAATEASPDSATAWGWLALASREMAEQAPPPAAAAATAQSHQAAERALALDAREPNARASLVLLRRDLDDLPATEARLRGILADAPANDAALTELVALLQSVGLCRESWVWNERAIGHEPLSPTHRQRRALKLWIFGRAGEADRVIDRARQLWPDNPLIWNTRMLVLAFTGRPQAARAMLDDAANRPAAFAPATLAVWRASLAALESRSARDVAAARDANLAAAPRSPGAAAHAVMTLSALGEVDGAYAVAEGFLLQRGPLAGPIGTGGGPLLASDPRWRRTQWLYTPATKAFRADPRFAALTEAIGLVDYWRRRGVRPDVLDG